MRDDKKNWTVLLFINDRLLCIESNGELVIGQYIVIDILFCGLKSEAHSGDHNMYYTTAPLLTQTQEVGSRSSICDLYCWVMRFESWPGRLGIFYSGFPEKFWDITINRSRQLPFTFLPGYHLLPSKHSLFWSSRLIMHRIKEVDPITKTKLNSVTFSPQANYTDRATVACWRR
jgi:hypothetical protein